MKLIFPIMCESYNVLEEISFHSSLSVSDGSFSFISADGLSTNECEGSVKDSKEIISMVVCCGVLGAV